ncbi:hypothetical protein [Streptomyces laurentii]|uniref:hypothetical protein n=1 Tax=Streptomyces laurentii TaxID=39478 RepID=UPI0036BABD3F
MYRHFIAPARGFTQFSHGLIRHPRLNSDAVRILTWQLSLPEGAKESLSRTAERAGIGGCAFTRAKRQLLAEGFLHERRTQVTGGRWTTQQLISNQPLNEAEAAKLMGRAPGTVIVVAASAPGPRNPAVGDPTGPLADGSPMQDRVGDTSYRPPEGEEPEAESDAPRTGEPPADDPVLGEPVADEVEPGRAAPDVRAEACALIGALPLLSPALRHIPPAMTDELTRLAAACLAAGHTSADIHAHLLRGLPRNGTPVYKPGGLVRYLLLHVPPAAPASPPPPPGPRLSARLADARECESGRHVQPMLFRPSGDEILCPSCTTTAEPQPEPDRELLGA